MRRQSIPRPALVAITALALGASTAAQTGHTLTGVGPVNSSMAGAGSAHPIDTSSAMHWNPAGLTGLPGSRVDLAVDWFRARTSVSSRVRAGAFGAGAPAATASGTTHGDSRSSYVPSLAWSTQLPSSDVAVGLSLFGIGGFGVDYQRDPGNPITSAQPPAGLGYGAVYSEYRIARFTGALAKDLGGGVSVGAGPTLSWSSLEVSPVSAAAPADTNGDGFASYPGMLDAAESWGHGWVAGLTWRIDDTWSVGVSHTSRSRFDSFKLKVTDEDGSRRSVRFRLDSPPITSLGASWARGPTRVALDVRHLAYGSTRGFSRDGYAPDGAVRGFAWNDIWAAALGVQHEIDEDLIVRAGYAWNESPIDSANAFVNTPSPGIIQDHLSLGASLRTTAATWTHIALQAGLGNTVSGRWERPAGHVNGTRVEHSLNTYSVSVGITTTF